MTRRPDLDGCGLEWVVVAEAGAGEVLAPPPRLRRIVAPVVIVAVVLAGVVGVGGWFVGRHIAEQQAVHDVAQLTDVLAQNVVQPALTDAMATDPNAARRRLDPIVAHQLLDTSLVRVKLWAPDGRVLYSDQPQLIGERFPLESDAEHALETPQIEADVTDLGRPENRFERTQGRLLVVYRPVWTPNGSPLLFETYFRYDAVTSRSHALWRGFGGVLLSSLAALLVLLAPLAWMLVARSRRSRAHREALTLRALRASEEERRRIAGTLHDGVVQQLAAASFTVAGTAERAVAAGHRELAADLDAVAATVRDGIAGLRSLLVGIYPPSLHSSGLAVALRDLARTGAGDADVGADIDADAADALPEHVQEAAFGVAQEALRNADKHAAARHVTLSLHRDGDVTRLEIADDGRGFEPRPAFDTAGTGHFGLQLMVDAARRGGARLAVASAPGRGSRVRFETVTS